MMFRPGHHGRLPLKIAFAFKCIPNAVKLHAHSVEHRVRESKLLFGAHKHDVYVDDFTRGHVPITGGLLVSNVLCILEHEETVIELHVHVIIHHLTNVKDGCVERPVIFFLIDVLCGTVWGDTFVHFFDVQETVSD